MSDAIKFWFAKQIVEIGVGVGFFVLLIVGVFVMAWLEVRSDDKKFKAERERRSHP